MPHPSHRVRPACTAPAPRAGRALVAAAALLAGMHAAAQFTDTAYGPASYSAVNTLAFSRAPAASAGLTTLAFSASEPLLGPLTADYAGPAVFGGARLTNTAGVVRPFTRCQLRTEPAGSGPFQNSMPTWSVVTTNAGALPVGTGLGFAAILLLETPAGVDAGLQELEATTVGILNSDEGATGRWVVQADDGTLLASAATFAWIPAGAAGATSTRTHAIRRAELVSTTWIRLDPATLAEAAGAAAGPRLFPPGSFRAAGLLLTGGVTTGVHPAGNQTQVYAAVRALRVRTHAAVRSALHDDAWVPLSGIPFLDTDGGTPFLQDFAHAGYRRGLAPIPETHDRAFPVAAGAPGEDRTAAIQAAIDAAEAHTAGGAGRRAVVELGAGVFPVSVPSGRSEALRIRGPGVVLRGAGRTATFLLNTTTDMTQRAVIRATPATRVPWTSESGSLPRQRITADLRRPVRWIPVENAAAFQPGDVVVLRFDMTDAWLAAVGEIDDWTPLVASGTLQPIMLLRTITAVDAAGQRVLVDAPTRYPMLVRDNARINVRSRGASGNPLPEDIGIERLAIGNVEQAGTAGFEMTDWSVPGTAAARSHYATLIVFSLVRNAWIRDITSYAPPGNAMGSHMLSNGILVENSANVTVADSFLGFPQYGGQGGNGYMFRIDRSNDVLVIRCTASNSRHGFTFAHPSASGNVITLSTDILTGMQSAPPHQTDGRGSDHHMWFSHANLVDASAVQDSWFEARDRFQRTGGSKHNTTGALSTFWNTGATLSPGFTQSTTGGSPPRWGVWSEQAGLGHVIGTRGPVTDVRLNGNQPTRVALFLPVDRTEALGLGDRLEPFSLYLDQVRLRALRGTPTTVLEQWRDGHFGTPRAVGFAGNAADADADGVDNLVEFALGTDPHASQPEALERSVAGGVLRMTYTPDAEAAAAVALIPEWSGDLVAWNRTGITTTTSTGPDGRTRVTASVPVVGAAVFLRLVAEER